MIELLIVVAIIVMIVVAAMPYYKGAMAQTQEMSAMQAIRTIQAAQVQFFSHTGKHAASLRELGAARFIAGDLAKGEKGGYRFRLDEAKEGYAIHAEPVKFGVNGRRTFYADDMMIIRENRGPEPATADSEEAK